MAERLLVSFIPVSLSHTARFSPQVGGLKFTPESKLKLSVENPLGFRTQKPKRHPSISFPCQTQGIVL
jgi:hypothetical protein